MMLAILSLVCLAASGVLGYAAGLAIGALHARCLSSHAARKLSRLPCTTPEWSIGFTEGWRAAREAYAAEKVFEPIPLAELDPAPPDDCPVCLGVGSVYSPYEGDGYLPCPECMPVALADPTDPRGWTNYA